jgi:uncharacterized membrane protein YkoI
MDKMNKKKIAAFVLVGVLALGGTVTAFATTANATSQNTPKATVEEQSTEAEAQDENVALPAGGIDQTTAEQKAQASIPGGVVVASELEDENGAIVYGVEIKTGNAVHDVKVDAITGSIIKADQDNDKDEKGNIEKESKAGDNDNIEHENDNEDPAGYED